MDGIEEIETEWGSELHRELIAQEAKARVEWRNSLEEMRRLKEAGPLQIDWAATLRRMKRKPVTRKVPIYVWSGLAR